MGVYWVMLAVFHVMIVLVHSGKPCTLQIESDREFVLLGQTAHLNCTSNCSEVYWETRQTKLSQVRKDYFTSIEVRINDYNDSPMECQVIADDNTLYKDVVRVEAYALPSKVDIDLNKELEENKEHEVKCLVEDVAPVKNVILSVTKGGEPFLSKTFEEDTRRGPQNLNETFKFTANYSDNGQNFTCRVTLNLTCVTNTTVYSSPITARTYGPPLPPSVHISTSTTSPGGTVALTCHSGGHPSPTYSWVIPSNAKVDFSKDNSSITIKEATTYHHGTYTCHVRNDYGHLSTSQNLEVKCGFTRSIYIGIGIGLGLLAVTLIGVGIYLLLKNGKKGIYDFLRKRQINPDSTGIPRNENENEEKV